jgi:hypothetical protein
VIKTKSNGSPRFPFLPLRKKLASTFLQRTPGPVFYAENLVNRRPITFLSARLDSHCFASSDHCNDDFEAVEIWTHACTKDDDDNERLYYTHSNIMCTTSAALSKGRERCKRGLRGWARESKQAVSVIGDDSRTNLLKRRARRRRPSSSRREREMFYCASK